MNRSAIPPPPAQRRKLVLSLAFNLATRVPGAIGVLLILPLLRRDLGVEGYGLLLGALALGSVATFLFGGFNTMGRRLIGEAHAVGDVAGEADALASLLAVNGCLFAAALAATGAYAALQADGGRMFVIASLASSAAFANTFDNARSAYNEHYVTALLQILFQAALIALAFLVRPVREDPVLAAVVIQGHMLLASVLAGAHLLRSRPYLLGGSLAKAGSIVTQGLRAGVADGLLAASMALSVVWVQSRADAALAGWYATLVRLFQTLAVPIALLLMPLSSYLRLGWHGRGRGRQQWLLRATALGGLIYGTFAATVLAVVSRLYIEGVLALPGPDEPLVLFAIMALFGTVIAYRSHAMIAYMVSDSARLGPWLGGGVVVSGAIAVIACGSRPPIEAVALNAALLSVVLLAWVLNCMRRERSRAVA